MKTSDLDLGLKMLRAAGIVSAAYLTVPVTGGMREVRLMQHYGILSREELRRDYAQEYKEQVFLANLREADVMAARLRTENRDRYVINPGSFDRPGWSQQDYMDFWINMLGSISAELRLPHQALLSSGGRAEITYALAAKMPIYDLLGERLGAAEIMTLDARARQAVKEGGWDDDQVESYIPFVDYVRIAEGSFEPDQLAIKSFAELATKHNAMVKDQT